MKRVFNYRKMMALAVSMILAGGIYAQIPNYDDGAGGSNFVQHNGVETIQITLGRTLPFFVEPSSYYHPGYDPETGAGLTAGFIWNWTVPAGLTLASQTNNYVTITAGTVGAYTVSVAEEAPPAWGGCVDATPVTIPVQVVATPTIALTTPAATSYTLCEGDPGLPATVSITPSGTPGFRFVWSLEIKTLDSGGADDDNYDTDKTTVIPGNAEDYTEAVPQAIAAAGAHNITSIAGGFTVINGQTTVYTYTVNSGNDLVSRKSDFLTLPDPNSPANDDFAYYDVQGNMGGANTHIVTITVYPTPVTGPIYHIPSNWAN